VRRYETTASVELANVIGAISKLPDYSIDIAAAVRAINANHAELARDAAAEALAHLANKWITKNGRTGQTAQWLDMARSEVRRIYPALARVVDGSPVTEQSLRDAYPQLFK
jgi:hypothetical protein